MTAKPWQRYRPALVQRCRPHNRCPRGIPPGSRTPRAVLYVYRRWCVSLPNKWWDTGRQIYETVRFSSLLRSSKAHVIIANSHRSPGCVRTKCPNQSTIAGWCERAAQHWRHLVARPNAPAGKLLRRTWQLPVTPTWQSRRRATLAHNAADWGVRILRQVVPSRRGSLVWP